jgi:hypothetical protein
MTTDKEAKEVKDAKDSKDSKDNKDAKDPKDTRAIAHDAPHNSTKGEEERAAANDKESGHDKSGKTRKNAKGEVIHDHDPNAQYYVDNGLGEGKELGKPFHETYPVREKDLHIPNLHHPGAVPPPLPAAERYKVHGIEPDNPIHPDHAPEPDAEVPTGMHKLNNK